MKIFAFSDSHRDGSEMRLALEKAVRHVGAVVHLGDGWPEIHELMRSYPQIPLYAVTGNCDAEPEQSVLTFHCHGRKILLTHGHTLHVKNNYERISLFAAENEADVCLFGHTHIPVIFQAGRTLMVNPGSIGIPKDKQPRTYAVIDIPEDGAIHAQIVGRQPGGAYQPILFA
ncbi:MAG: metallophosphoesterase [Clostridiales bacterium]|jgi:putative phosphoesterase|nr:metallophosphoesterase [Clostridiales bacterium]